MKKFIISTLLIFLMAFVFVAADGDLSGSPIASESGDPGTSVTFDIVYFNAGATAMTVSSTSSSLISGANTISAPTIGSVSVPANGSATVSFTMTVPAKAAGIYTGIITGTDTTNSTNIESLPYSLTINSKDSFTTSVSSLSFDVHDQDESETFSITNDGSTTLSSWIINFTSSDGDIGKVLDNDDDEMSVSFSGASSSLTPGSSMTVTATLNPDSDMDFGSYSGTIGVSATGSSTKSSSLSLSAELVADICEEGKQGSDFDIEIRNPDDGDDFIPGDTIPMEVKIENKANDDLDVEVEVTLYNTDTGNKEKVVRVEGSIDEDETETFSFDFELPTDLDEDDNYELFVQVHEDGNEDDSCDYESVEIDFDREDQDAVISDTSLSPEVGLVCGDDYRVSIVATSTGADSINDLYIELRDADLDVEENSDTIDLGDFDDSDNEEKISFDLSLPNDIKEGSYSLEAILNDKNGNTLDSELITVTVSSCSEEEAVGDLNLDISEDYSVEGNELTLNMIVSNNGEDDKVISIIVEDVSWAETTGTEYLSLLQAGDEAHGYVYLSLDDTTEGKHDIQITVSDDAGNEVTEIVTVDFGEKAAEADSFFAGVNTWFAEKTPGSFWILVDVILIVLALVFLRMLFSKK
ncbi:MAG: putative S-layer protein [bacterium]|nr:putative S-layer protein [bacterium]